MTKPISGFGNKTTSFERVASTLLNRRDRIFDALVTIETRKTAEIEFEKTIRALQSYNREIPYLQERRPVGTVGVFLPFNTPLYSLILYTFGSLFVGNRVLVKPSSLVTDIAQVVFDVIKQSAPELELELDVRPGRDFLERCLYREKVGALIFTGSWSNAERLLETVPKEAIFVYCGSGINPFIVRSDANIRKAAMCAVQSRFYNSGQDCLSPERFYIDYQVYEEFREALTALISNTQVGANCDPHTDIGPLITEKAVTNVENLLVAGGVDRVWYGKGGKGHQQIAPIVVDAQASAPVVLEEKFAPVFPLVRVETEQDIVDSVNSIPYGLGATFFGHVPISLLSNIHVAHIAHNGSLLEIEDTDAHMPFGGYKRSGFVSHAGHHREGPILFSIETSIRVEG